MCKSIFPVEFDYTPRNFQNTTEIDLNGPGGLNSQIISYVKPRIFNTIQGLVDGAYAAELQVYDPMIKLMSSRVFDINDMYTPTSEHVSGPNPMVSLDNENWFTTGTSIAADQPPPIESLLNTTELGLGGQFPAHIQRHINMSHSFDNKEHGEKETFRGITNPDSARLERNALLQILKQNKILVKIPFRSDIRSGNIIQLKLGPMQLTEQDTQTDLLNDGKYLITGITFTGTPGRGLGTLTLECVKESFANNIKSVRPLDNFPSAEEIG